VDSELERINREQRDSEVDPFTERRYRQFARHLGSGFTGQVLDVGCNTGRGGRALAAAVSNVTLDGVELLEDRITRIPAGTGSNRSSTTVTSSDFQSDGCHSNAMRSPMLS